jgi:hypothetical protein
MKGHFGFKPIACTPGCPEEKGIVENGVKYVKINFMPGRSFGSLAEARTALRYWQDNIANIRIHGTTRQQPIELFQNAEKQALEKLNPLPFDCSITENRRADSRCRVCFDGNSYSVPDRCAGKRVIVKAEPDTVRIYLENVQAAMHSRSYGRNMEIVDPDHTEGIRRTRKRAREQNLIHDFLQTGNAAAAFLEGVKLKQLNHRQHLRNILILAETTGRERVADALETAVEFQTFRSEYVENLVMQSHRGKKVTTGRLHVPRAGDQLELRLEQPDLNVYKI